MRHFLRYNIIMNRIRLNKFLAESGVCSRRRADELIMMGKVKVGKNVVKQLGVKIDPDRDKVFVEDKLIGKKEENVYYILNKPVGYVATAFDPYGRRKVTDLVPKSPRVYPVGRLDYDTSGLLILTNDGELTNRLTHPRYEKEKEYEVTVKISNLKSQIPNKSQIQNSKKYLNILISQYLNLFKKGIRLKEGIARVDKIKILDRKGDIIKFSLVIHQGWNRQIRRMCETVGLEVIELKRVRVGGLKLGDLKEGRFIKISEGEIKKFF